MRSAVCQSRELSSRRAMSRLFAIAAAGLALAVFAVALALGYRGSPDLGGVLTGAVTGIFSALIVLAGIFWGVMGLITRPPAARPINPVAAAEIDALLAPALAALERTRRDLLMQMVARALPRVPLGMAAGFILEILGQQDAEAADVFGFLFMIAMGGLVGGVWAVYRPSETYRKLYKAKVLPALAARFGALTFRAAAPVDFAALRRFDLFEAFDTVEAEDEIAGSYRDHPLRIVELQLSSGAGEDRRFAFDGLLIELVLPRNLLGTTVIAVDRGLPEAMRGFFLSRQDARLQRVRLEDPEFERIYEIYGNDQVEARALLHPTFMVRFLDLSKLKAFGLPRAFAEGNRFTILLPKTMPKNLFEPPSAMKPALNRQALAGLHHDIRAVLDVTDAVIALDGASPAAAAARS